MNDPPAETLAPLNDEDKARLTAGATMFGTAPIASADLPAVNMADGPMGVASTRVDERDVSALTPCPTALAASWDPMLVRRVSALVADEARARNVQVMLAPNAGLPRSPLAGRAFETFSEDPYLTGELVAAWIGGLQSRGVGACVKHMAGNDSETARDSMNAVIDERALREVYLAPFERAVEAGCWGVLMAYNRLNGPHCVEHRELISDILKGEWGFDGFVVSDWFGTFDTVRSADAGLDLEMPGPARVFGERFLHAVQAGEVAAGRLDDAASRMVRLAERAKAALAPPLAPAEDPQALLTEAAAEGFVLLTNDRAVLPLRPERGRRVAVIGPNAATPCYQGGTFAKIGLRPDAVTPLDALRTALGAEGVEVDCQVGVRPEYRLPPIALTPTADASRGERGFTVDYFAGRDTSAPPRASEVRNTNSLTWFGVTPGPITLSEPLTVRARGVFTPDMDGPHHLLVGGTGSVRLKVDGREVFAEDIRIEPKDVMGRLKSGIANGATVHLRAGSPVELEFTLLAEPARAQGLWWGCRPPADADAELDAAVAAAKAADEVVLLVGETPDSGVESIDRADTFLPAAQIELIRRVAAANPNTVVIVNAAHAVDLSWAGEVAAVMMAWFPGEAFGAALADVLLGRREPGGRLPVSFAAQEADYPAYGLEPDENGDLAFAEGVRIGYRGFAAKGADPRFGLGHGLGYGEVAFEDLHCEGGANGELWVLGRAANQSDRETKAVLQAYVTATAEAVPFPRLAGFVTRRLAAGETAELSVELDPRAFRFWDVDAHAWRATPGPHEVRVGASLQAAVVCGSIEGR